MTHDEGFLIWRPVPITWPLELRGDVFRRVPREEAVASDPDPEPRPEPKPTIDPDAVRAAAAERLSLAAVLYGREPRAVINASTVSEGDWVSGYLVRRIEKTRVLLERDGVSIELRP